MSEVTPAPKPRENWFIYLPLVLLSTLFVLAGMGVTAWAIEEYLGYSGVKSGVFWALGGLAAYYLTHPLWMLYRRYYPKADQPA